MNNYVIDVLEKSVQKNGEIPLTNKHLLNILKMAENNEYHERDCNLTDVDMPDEDSQ